MSKIVSRYEIWRVHGYFAWLPKYSQEGYPWKIIGSIWDTPVHTEASIYFHLPSCKISIFILLSSQAIWPPARSRCWSWKSGQQRPANCSPMWCQTRARYRKNRQIKRWLSQYYRYYLTFNTCAASTSFQGNRSKVFCTRWVTIAWNPFTLTKNDLVLQ